MGLKMFYPLAYYDKDLDTICVEIRNCSKLERLIDDHLTVFLDNHPNTGQSRTVGFILRGVSVLLKEWGLLTDGVVFVVQILDQLVERYSQEIADELETVFEISRNIELQIDLNESDVVSAAA